MGLDMYALVVKNEKEKPEEFAYWRKHYGLQYWFESQYRKRHPEDEESFNCVDMILYNEDLDALEDYINKYGLSREDYICSEDNLTSTLQFIQDARENLKNGYIVYYTSWW